MFTVYLLVMHVVFLILFSCIHQGEFLCPLCRLLANSALPRSSPRRKKQRIINASGSFPAIGHKEAQQHKLFHIWHSMILLQTTALMVSKVQILDDYPDRQNERVESNSSSFVLSLEAMYLGRNAGDSLIAASGNKSTIMWDAVKYSLIATEIGARSSSTSLSPSYGLGSLCVGQRSVSKDLLSVFLEAAETIRTENRTDVLLRLKGIQLFAQSVCLGHSWKGSPSSASEQAGELSFFWCQSCTEIDVLSVFPFIGLIKKDAYIHYINFGLFLCREIEQIIE